MKLVGLSLYNRGNTVGSLWGGMAGGRPVALLGFFVLFT
jgi:hypothetical protein